MKKKNAIKILLASNHPLKKRLFELAFAKLKLKVKIVTPRQLKISGKPRAVFETEKENALAKAEFFCQKSHLPTLADDLGLRIKALGGEPGVFVRRWGGHFKDEVDDETWLKYLFKKLCGVNYEDRIAFWDIAWALVRPDGQESIHKFSVKFLITEVPRRPYPKGFPVMAVRWDLEKHKHYLDLKEEERWIEQIREMQKWNIKNLLK